MRKHNLIILIIVSLVLSFTLNIQFNSREVYAQSEDNINEQFKAERVQTLLQRAKQHIERGRLEYAENTLSLLLQTVDPKNFEAQLMLSEIYLKNIPYFNQETRQMLRSRIQLFVEKHAEKYADNKEFCVLAAKYYRSKLDLMSAMKFAQKALDVEAENVDSLMVLGDANLYLGKVEEARKIYETLLKIQPDNADVQITMLDIYTDESNFEQMQILTEKILKNKRISESVRSNYCVDTAVEIFPEDYKIAQKFMQYAIEIQPSLNYRLMKSVMVYDAAKTNFDEKIKFIEAARIDISAENSLREIKDISDKIIPEVNPLKAILFYHIDEFEKSWEFVKKSKAFDTDEYPEFMEYTAYIAEKNDDLELALSAFNVLHEREPEVKLFQTKIAMLERIKNKVESAEDKNALTSKLFTAYRMYFNTVYSSSKTPAEMLVSYTKALDFDQDNPWVCKEKGFIELNHEFKFADAYKSYKTAYAVLMDDAQVMLSLAISNMLDAQNADYSDAEAVLTKLNEKYPGNFTYLKYLEILNSIKSEKVKAVAYALYYQAAYTEDLATRLETCEKAYLAQENLFEPLLLWGKISIDSATKIRQSMTQYDPESEDFKSDKKRVDDLLKTAEDSITQAISNARNDEQKYEAMLELAGLQANMGKLDVALVTLQPALNSVNPSSDALLLALNLYLQEGMNVKAHLNAAKLLSLYPDHPFNKYEPDNAYYNVETDKYVDKESNEKPLNIQPKFEQGLTYRYQIDLNLQGWSGANTEMDLSFRMSVKVVDVPTPGFYKLEFEVLCIRGTDLFDDVFDKTFIIDMSDILGICAFEAKTESDKIDNKKLSRFLGFVMPYVTEMFAFSPSNKLVKIGETWVKRTQGGMLHFAESNEASFIANNDEEAVQVVRLIKSGNEVRGNLADFESRLTFNKTQNLATEMTFDYWNLIPDAQDETRIDWIEAKTRGSIKLTLIK